ncbi:MAG: HAD-IA family hydrolase [Chloroflexota bacterium]|nr:HAD-IA family hydrolase [Chloroflexota bacterium]
MIFDLDGTLADTGPVMAGTLAELASKSEQRLSQADIDKHVHLGFPAFLSKLGLEKQRGEYWGVYRKHAAAAHFFPWALSLLRTLRARGIAVGVVTTLPTEHARALIAGAGATELIEPVIGAGCARLKPDPEGILKLLHQVGVPATEAVMVGDSAKDMTAGRAAGCLTAAVGWGLTPQYALVREQPDVSFADGASFSQWLLSAAETFSADRCEDCPASVYHRGSFAALCHARCSVQANVLAVPSRACPRCANIIGTGALCEDCLWRKRVGRLAVHGISCMWLYTQGDPLASAVRAFKGVEQPARLELALPLGRLFLAKSVALAAGTDVDHVLEASLDGLLVPVPTSSASRQKRGFAPVEKLLTAFFAQLLTPQLPILPASSTKLFSELGAASAGRALLALDWQAVMRTINGSGSGWQVCDALEKRMATELKHLGAKERAAAVQGAYVLKPDVKSRIRGQTIYLVDDIVTSGATINECARVLMEHGGAKAVHVIALARNYRQPPMTIEERCPRCGTGLLQVRYTKVGRQPFLGCTRWRRDSPDSCGYTRPVDQAPSQGMTPRRPLIMIDDNEELPF